MIDSAKIAIIGPGRLGLTIATLAKLRGLKVIALGGRNKNNCEEAVAFIDRTVGSVDHKTLATDPVSACSKAELVFLTVPDTAIQPLCNELVKNNAFSPGTVVVHLSGALSSTILSSAKELSDCKIASAHPLQTFANTQSALADLPGTHWFLEGDTEAVEILSKFIEIIEGKVSTITPEQKALYHAASVMASNYLTTLIDAAAITMEAANIDRHTALKALEPLIRSAVRNTFTVGPEQALTGPISRGDDLTVRTHLSSLELVDKNLTSIYTTLGQHAVKLAVRKGSLDGRQAQVLLETLTAKSTAS